MTQGMKSLDPLEEMGFSSALLDRERRRLRQELNKGTLNSETLERLVRRSLRWSPRSVPMIPDDYVTLLRILRRNPSMGALEAKIPADSKLAGHIIGTANSSMFKGRSPVTTLRNAMVRLGIDLLKELIYRWVIMDTIFKPQTEEHVTWIRKMSFRAVASAYMAKEIATRVGVSGDEAFLGALLHDVGEPYIVNLLDLMRVPLPHDTVEKTVAKVHEETGAVLLRRLNFPESVCQAAETHHDPVASAANSVSLISAVTDQLLLKYKIMTPPLWEIRETKAPFRLLGFTEFEVEGLLDRFQEILDLVMQEENESST